MKEQNKQITEKKIYNSDCFHFNCFFNSPV